MSRQPLLAVDQLTLSYRSGNLWQPVVHNVSFEINPGEMVALVGESGSGKTTTAQAIIGLMADNARRDHGEIRLNGVDISQWSQKRYDSLRGARISLVPQDPGNSLNPVKTIGEQVAEILRLHLKIGAAQRQQRVIELLTRVGLSHPEQRVHQYPHHLSGGMKQRVLIAIALALQPELIIADEPTSALDVTVQKRILDLLDQLRRESGTAVLFVTHDLALAAQRADRIMVFRHGEIQESAPSARLIDAPAHPYTRQLLHDAAPQRRTRTPPQRSSFAAPAIQATAIAKSFALGKQQRLQALDQVSFQVARGTTHALVGESGSGKTTLARIVMGFETADSGTVSLDGRIVSGLRGEALRQLRRKIQFVYQNPFASLDPRQTLYEIIEEPLRNFERLSREVRRQRVEAVTTRVALPLAMLTRRPHQLSGGQRQRIALARALITEPDILVLDEATSALDVTVQAQILDLLQQLQAESGLTYLFITHDLATVRQIADSVTVLKAGEVAEQGDVVTIFSAPRHPYTRELIAAIPPLIPLNTLSQKTKESA
jgi:peptide/nickel transport system ATP-binding protein